MSTVETGFDVRHEPLIGDAPTLYTHGEWKGTVYWLARCGPLPRWITQQSVTSGPFPEKGTQFIERARKLTARATRVELGEPYRDERILPSEGQWMRKLPRRPRYRVNAGYVAAVETLCGPGEWRVGRYRNPSSLNVRLRDMPLLIYVQDGEPVGFVGPRDDRP